MYILCAYWPRWHIPLWIGYVVDSHPNKCVICHVDSFATDRLRPYMHKDIIPFRVEQQAKYIIGFHEAPGFMHTFVIVDTRNNWMPNGSSLFCRHLFNLVFRCFCLVFYICSIVAIATVACYCICICIAALLLAPRHPFLFVQYIPCRLQLSRTIAGLWKWHNNGCISSVIPFLCCGRTSPHRKQWVIAIILCQ